MNYMIKKKPKRIPTPEIKRFYHPEVLLAENFLYQCDWDDLYEPEEVEVFYD